MNSISDTPTFNLKVVLQETGIKPDTIRAWERRYGLPNPERTSGGHRLYSQRDIEMIKWLMARQDEGLSISRAVNLWCSIKSDGRDPLEEDVFQSTRSASPPKIDFPVGTALEEIRQSWVEACLAFDEARAEAVLTHAFALYPAEVVCTEVLQNGIAQIGQGWYQGQMSVQQEHFASALALRKLNALISASPAPFQKEKIIVACPPNEDHTFPALLITLFLRQRGWPVIYLGGNVPLNELSQTIDNLNPHLLVMPAQQLYTAARLGETAQALLSQVQVAFGGLIFNLLPEIYLRIPGHFIGEDLLHAIPTIEQLICQKTPHPPVKPVSNEYKVALIHYQTYKAAIEAHTWEILNGNDIEQQHLVIANHHLTQDIEASLMLGDIGFLANEINWLEVLLTNYNVSPTGLRRFLHIYYKAAEKTLDDRGQLIIHWLSEALESS